MLKTISVAHEEAVNVFRFWFRNAVHEGICQDNDLYALVNSFTEKDKLWAYRLGRELVNQEIPIIVTVGNSYKIWKSLKAQYWTEESKVF